MAHVAAWMRVLVFRWPESVPQRLLPYWWSVWLLIGTAAVSVATLQPGTTSVVSFGLLGLLLAGIVRAAAGTFGLQYVATPRAT